MRVNPYLLVRELERTRQTISQVVALADHAVRVRGEDPIEAMQDLHRRLTVRVRCIRDTLDTFHRGVR